VYKRAALSSPDDMLIDEAYAAPVTKPWAYGDAAESRLARRRVIEAGKLARIAVQLNVLQDLDAATGKVGRSTSSGRPHQLDASSRIERPGKRLQIKTLRSTWPCIRRARSVA